MRVRQNAKWAGAASIVLLASTLFLAGGEILTPQDSAPRGAIQLLVRADDMGVAQSINEACIQACRDGIARSVEVIVPGPWFLDAVRRLKEHPDLEVGVHLTLTSEWERLKWRPLTHAPSLVDADGYFRPMTRQRPGFPPDTGFLDAKPDLGEVERELRAQIETAKRHFGEQVNHLSSHMGAARATPELSAVTARLAKEHGLRMESPGLKSAGGFGSSDQSGEAREQALVDLIERLQPGRWLLVEHPGLDTPEMRAIGHKGYENVAADRAAVTRAFTSAKVKEAVVRRQIELIRHVDLPGEWRGRGPSCPAMCNIRYSGLDKRLNAAPIRKKRRVPLRKRGELSL